MKDTHVVVNAFGWCAAVVHYIIIIPVINQKKASGFYATLEIREGLSAKNYR